MLKKIFNLKFHLNQFFSFFASLFMLHYVHILRGIAVHVFSSVIWIMENINGRYSQNY